MTDETQKAARPMPDSPSGQATLPEPTFIRRVFIGLGAAALFTIAFLLLAYAANAIILVFAAIWFAAVLYHAAGTLSRWTGLSRKWSLTAVVTLVVVAAIGFVILLGVQIAMQMNELMQSLREAVDMLRSQLKEFPQLNQFLNRPESAQDAVRAIGGGKTGSTVAMLLTSPFGLVVNVLFIFFTGAYLASGARMYRDGFVSLFPVQRRPSLKRVCSEVGDSLWRWTLARLFSMTLVGTLAGVGLALLGVPMAVTLGVTTGLFVFVPNIGPILATIPPLLLSFSMGSWMPLYVLALYIGIELIESWIITPIIHEKEDDLPAAIVLAAQLLFGILFGLLGVTFAMPIALAAMIFVQRLYIEHSLEGEPSPEEESAPD